MPTIFIDPAMNNGQAEWDEVETAVLEQAQFAIAEFRKQHPQLHMLIGDQANFVIDVKIKDITGTTRAHGEIGLSKSMPGLSFSAIGGSPGNPVSAPSVASSPASGGSLWSGPSPTAVPSGQMASPKTAKSNKTPTHIPMPAVVSSATKCNLCGSPGTLGLNDIYCSNPSCKNH